MNGIFEWIIFLSLSTIAVVTAAGMILTMSMYRAGLALMASFVALAGLFILLNADLLAAIQIMMNVGGMLVMVLFMVMMMIDPGGEMMWGMKRDMHMPGLAAFSMHMPRGKPPEEESTQEQPGTHQVNDWTCPMHPEVQQDHPGNCPKCGMTLMQAEAQQSVQETSNQSKVYTCPMHPEVREHQPGSCPKCGMTLVEAETEEPHQADTLKTYTCPMHPEVQQDQPGNCPKCGMTLRSTDDTSQSHATGEHAGMSMEQGAHTMSGMSMEQSGDGHRSHDMSMPIQASGESGHDMNISQHDMNMFGMTPRQYYQMMVDMAMSTSQLPWAIALGIASALLLIVLVVQTPCLILAGIAGAVLLGKRERTQLQLQMPSPEPQASDAGEQTYTCPMHPEVRESRPGNCPKCGMTLIPAEETVGSQHKHGGHS